MPSEIEIYADIVLFDIRVAFSSNDRRALDAALALYPEWENRDAPQGGAPIYVVLRGYDVNRFGGDVHHVEGHLLAIEGDGMSAKADGRAGQGSCDFALDFDAAKFADLVNTMVLFLLGHAGRVPLHASAVMLGDTAIVFAGASGAGKSTLALAASRKGLPLLSDDTIFIQSEPCFRLWSLAGRIHVFEKDAPPDAEGGMRLRGGRWKKSLPAGERRYSADRAIVCLLSRDEVVTLTPLPKEDAVAALTAWPEPGYQFYGEASWRAARALAEGGAWRLGLSADPAEAIALIRRRFMPRAGISFHDHYVTLVAQIERRFAVMRWICGDADLWPLARFDLYLDMYWANTGAAPPRARGFGLRLISHLFKPLLNLWRSRHDLGHWCGWPKSAPVVFLGDGVSLDCVDGAYQDRQGEPVMAALEKRGAHTFLMQSGELVRLPWRRPTFAANLVEAWGWLLSPFFRRGITLPDHAALMAFLGENGVPAPSLERTMLARRARLILASAFLFEFLLKRVRPKLALVASYYAGLGPAFVLACRRRAILSVDLQHAPLQGAPMAYIFAARPEGGYSTLPTLFWSWTRSDAEAVEGGLYGGPPQLAARQPSAGWEHAFRGNFDREILVALQPIHGHRADWEALAAQIEAAPPSWRWWIRRHPASRPCQDAEFGRLLTMRLPQLRIAEASALPLPVLLGRMSAVLSLASGVAVEAAMFGVPAYFLSPQAYGPFGALVDSGNASIIGIDQIRDRIENLPARPSTPLSFSFPDIDVTLNLLDEAAADYSATVFRDCVNREPTRCAR